MSSESDGGGGNMIESMPHFMSILYPGSLEKADIEKFGLVWSGSTASPVYTVWPYCSCVLRGRSVP
ncbi:hypothetical protein Pmar_PMAR005620 [Perkinsus marinus ATCC 50983]|uniref:Uncharacterized protein n=1 Tax=Perkinsus marinus (strain ATCC 50983 / TXsc) TaxID=423536 RepID=C5KLH5_PERM5|nr:hypothetical protein Pmar_PMAR005620 [Perkinsus marinus ATCC 50983]EER14670.1 hypothetical protein Pmar_PMAR005620 [Perkinsus marinus ATCC 50983]|eukprot:XP_002782874.1 hypothetical protein Pmar_PMAR005620 [Perkinsus marinus ATCC 50983]